MEVDERGSSFAVKCSWVESKSSVEKAITILDFDKDEEYDEGVPLAADHCVHLTQPDESDLPLSIDLISNDPSLTFRKLHILSEASYLEIYGLFGEYIKTVPGELLEDVDGTLAFSCFVNDIHLSHLTVKFVGLKGAKQVWLFGGSVWTRRDEASPSTSGQLNMERIDRRLSEGSCRLSPSADSLRKLVTDYIGRGAGGAPTVTSLASNLLRQHKPLTVSDTSQTLDFIKTYIDSSMKKMESRLMDNVTEQIRELELRQNKRLDHILKILENSAPPPNPNP